MVFTTHTHTHTQETAATVKSITAWKPSVPSYGDVWNLLSCSGEYVQKTRLIPRLSLKPFSGAHTSPQSSSRHSVASNDNHSFSHSHRYVGVQSERERERERERGFQALGVRPKCSLSLAELMEDTGGSVTCREKTARQARSKRHVCACVKTHGALVWCGMLFMTFTGVKRAISIQLLRSTDAPLHYYLRI